MTDSPRTILITGGAGFLGSHLGAFFLDEGHRVVAVDNLLTGSPANVARFAGEDYRFIDHDVTNPLTIDEDVDDVLHFASPASPVDYLRYPIETLEVGSRGTKNALDLARDQGARFMLASTSEVYGDPLVNPQPESYWGHVNPIGPRSVYDEAKRFAEALTMAYHRAHGLETRIARIFNTYGPHMRIDDGRAVPNFMRQGLAGEPLTVYGDGEQTRSFCYVDDTVCGLAALLRGGDPDPVNIGNPQEVTIREVAERIIGLTGGGSQLVFEDLPVDDPKVRRPDIRRGEELLGWRPVVDLADGLERTLGWFRSLL